jgi:hypothetical protein
VFGVFFPCKWTMQLDTRFRLAGGTAGELKSCGFRVFSVIRGCFGICNPAL